MALTAITSVIFMWLQWERAFYDNSQQHPLVLLPSSLGLVLLWVPVAAPVVLTCSSALGLALLRQWAKGGTESLHNFLKLPSQQEECPNLNSVLSAKKYTAFSSSHIFIIEFHEIQKSSQMPSSAALDFISYTGTFLLTAMHAYGFWQCGISIGQRTTSYLPLCSVYPILPGMYKGNFGDHWESAYKKHW